MSNLPERILQKQIDNEVEYFPRLQVMLDCFTIMRLEKEIESLTSSLKHEGRLREIASKIATEIQNRAEEIKSILTKYGIE